MDYASSQRKPGKHLVGLVMVVVLHALLFWAINSGLARAFVKKLKGPVEAVLLEEQKPDIPPPPPPPPPKNAPPPPPPPAYVPPVDVPVAAATAANAIAAVSNVQAPPAPPAPPPPPPPPPPPAPPREVLRTAAVVNAAACEKPEYPSASRRAEEEGTVTLRFLVGVDGKVLQAEVEKSSGYKRLDEAARAGLSRCQFKPATADGKPEQAWATLRYTWRLE